MSALIGLSIDATAIASSDVSAVEEVVAKSMNAYRSKGTALPLILLGTSAFDHDPRALYDIAEMRAWSRLLYDRVPFIFTFLAQPVYGWFFPCVAQIRVVERRADETDYTYLDQAHERLAQEILDAEARLFASLAATPEERAGLTRGSPTRALDALVKGSE